MTRTRSALYVGCFLLGLSLTTVCQANSAVKPPQSNSDGSHALSAAELYNLGNSYAEQGKPALAILNYERARLLAPQNSDIKANLQRVREMSSVMATPRGFASNLRLMSPNATYWWGIVGLMIAGIAGLLVTVKKSPPLALKATLGVGLVLVAFAVSDAAITAHFMREAVVMQSTTASASPIANADALFSLNPAALVQIEDEHGNFYLVRDSHNNLGWVMRGQIMPIVNPEGDFHA